MLIVLRGVCLLKAEVHPKCGRVVGFGAGKENPHGVKAVTRGQRCAVALWFTLDPAHEEKVRKTTVIRCEHAQALGLGLCAILLNNNFFQNGERWVRI